MAAAPTTTTADNDGSILFKAIRAVIVPVASPTDHPHQRELYLKALDPKTYADGIRPDLIIVDRKGLPKVYPKRTPEGEVAFRSRKSLIHPIPPMDHPIAASCTSLVDNRVVLSAPGCESLTIVSLVPGTSVVTTLPSITTPILIPSPPLDVVKTKEEKATVPQTSQLVEPSDLLGAIPDHVWNGLVDQVGGDSALLAIHRADVPVQAKEFPWMDMPPVLENDRPALLAIAAAAQQRVAIRRATAAPEMPPH